MRIPAEMNRKITAKNKYQGDAKRVLCVCSAGLLRSPTAALVLSGPPYNFNTRAAGLVPEFALIPVDEVLLHWADEIVCMEHKQIFQLQQMGFAKDIYCLDLKDIYMYRDPDLIIAINEAYSRVTNGVHHVKIEVKAGEA